MNWQIKIQEPSGETRYFPLKGAMTLGRGTESDLVLRDPTLLPLAARLWEIPGSHPSSQPSFWIRATDAGAPLKMADIEVREALLPPGLPIVLGETTFTLEPFKTKALGDEPPSQPVGARHWLTHSEEGKALLWNAKKSARTPLSIYLAGETGTGKEVLARLVHLWSDRASGPFVPLHCGALALSLAESELFGHVKGAFTGAAHHRPGALMQAHGGTLFLDEIGDLSMDIQVKLLRFLEDGEIRPVGADHTSHANVRLVCATHLPLQKLVEEGRFRRDLYYRLASVTLEIPPLRNRPEDIELLAHRFASQFGRSIAPQAMLRLKAHAWPGNVRELRHSVERACGLAAPYPVILGEEAFSFLLTRDNVTRSPELEIGAPILTLEEMERLLILRALRLAHGNRAKAAMILGIARSTLFEMLKRHKIQGPRARVA